MDDCLSQVESLIERHPADMNNVAKLEVVAMRAQAAIRDQDLGGLRQGLAEALPIIRAIGLPNQYRIQPSACLIAEAAVWWGAKAPSDERSLARHTIKRTMGFLGRFARSFPIGKARQLWLKGHLQQQKGNQRQADHLWQESISTAGIFSLPYDEVRVWASRLAYGRLSDEDTAVATGRYQELLAQMEIDPNSFLL